MSEQDKIELSVLCNECKESYKMKYRSFKALEQGKHINCDKCSASVELEKKPKKTLGHMFIVIYIALASLAMLITSLGNLLGYLNFPTYFIAVPFILSIAVIASVYKSNPTKLVAVNDQQS